jgi:DNA-binding transcriptional LysR family regulator
MDLRQLEYVVAVAEELSFTRAAARCHIVQSGLSFQIAKLERELGMVIFERTSRTVRLSPAGEALLPYARRALSAVESARSELAAMSGVVRGTLRIGVIPVNHGSIDLPALLQAYHRRYPEVDVVVSDVGSLTMVSMIQAGDLDAAILGLFPEQLPAALSVRLLRVEPLVAIMDAANPCARRRRVGLRELSATTAFIDCHQDSGLRTQVDLAFTRSGASRHISFELGNLLDVARIASLGLAAAIVPESVAHTLPPEAEGHFAVRHLTDRQAVQPVSLVSRPVGAGSHAARAFVDLFDTASFDTAS